MSSRKIEDCIDELQEKYRLFESGCKLYGVDYVVTCTKRTPGEQAELYAQGRTKPGKIRTWTLKSKHLTGEAFDFVIMVHGKPDWNMDYPDLWEKAIEIAKSVGLRQIIGENGKPLEYAHLQVA